MRILYERLKELLALGFYPDNFLQAARLAEEASWQVDHPSVLTSSRIARSKGATERPSPATTLDPTSRLR